MLTNEEDDDVRSSNPNIIDLIYVVRKKLREGNNRPTPERPAPAGDGGRSERFG